MSSEETLPDLETFAPEFFGLPVQHLPQERELLAQALMAEALRLAMYSKTENRGDWPRIHVLALRRWAIRKLRDVFMSSGLKAEEYLNQVLYEAAGPNLENIGDFIALSNGYYSPAPTRVVQVDQQSWLLVSGRPAKDFLSAGVEIRVHGAARWIVECARDNLNSLGIPEQTRESYIGDTWSTLEPTRFLYECVDSGVVRNWVVEAGSQAYVGPTKGRRGFQWGSPGLTVATRRGAFSLWKSPREFDHFDYFLRVDSGTASQGVLLSRPLAVRALLALDAATQRQRQALIGVIDTGVVLGLDFYPPAPEMRWIHAMGGVFRGSVGPRLQWRFPSTMSQQVTNLLRSMWIDAKLVGVGEG